MNVSTFIEFLLLDSVSRHFLIALMNLFESMVFLIIQDLRSKFTTQKVNIVFTLKIRERQTPIAHLE